MNGAQRMAAEGVRLRKCFRSHRESVKFPASRVSVGAECKASETLSYSCGGGCSVDLFERLLDVPRIQPLAEPLADGPCGKQLPQRLFGQTGLKCQEPSGIEQFGLCIGKRHRGTLRQRLLNRRCGSCL